MRGTMRPRFVRLALFAALALGFALPGGAARGQTGFNQREVKGRVNVEDKDGVWVLKLNFKDPRLITVDIPGRGRRLVWYMWYQVVNLTGEPRLFIPDFELVNQGQNTVHHDQILPKAQEAIRKLEDPTGYLDIKNSVTISLQPIPPSKADATPITVTGVAMWDDVNPAANRFSIFVSGLSNGWTEVDAKQPDGQPIRRRKTLQLNFRRVGQDIQFVPPADWVYRAPTLNTTPEKPGAPKPAADKDKAKTSGAIPVGKPDLAVRNVPPAPPLTIDPIVPAKSTTPR